MLVVVLVEASQSILETLRPFKKKILIPVPVPVPVPVEILIPVPVPVPVKSQSRSLLSYDHLPRPFNAIFLVFLGNFKLPK